MLNGSFIAIVTLQMFTIRIIFFIMVFVYNYVTILLVVMLNKLFLTVFRYYKIILLCGYHEIQYHTVSQYYNIVQLYINANQLPKICNRTVIKGDSNTYKQHFYSFILILSLDTFIKNIYVKKLPHACMVPRNCFYPESPWYMHVHVRMCGWTHTYKHTHTHTHTHTHIGI